MEATIGFDLRSIAPDPDWTEDRRAGFLLRRDVASVRSVDPLVWVRPPGFPPTTAAAWRTPESLWPDLSGLLAAAPALDHAGAAAVRITAFEEDGGRTPESIDPIGPPFDGYDLLGYDVADWYLMSGLTNCGYAPKEAALAPVWAPLLNEWHLFSNTDDVAAFADVTALRVPEHAPFFGYGIYQLR